MLLHILALTTGVLLALALPMVPAPVWPVMVGGLAFGLMRFSSLQLAGLCLAGFAWTLIVAHLRLSHWWDAPMEEADVWVEGIVWTLPADGPLATRFQFRTEKICRQVQAAACGAGHWQPYERLLLLSLYEARPLVPGQRWRWQVRLKRPHGQANPGGYDFEAWALQQGISATGYVRQPEAALLLDRFTLHRWTERWRQQLRSALQKAGAGLQHLGLVQALALGDGSGITPAQWTLFRRSGTLHLMVISGSHISLVASLVYALALRCARLSGRLLLRQPAPRLAAWAGIAAAWLYTALAGFNLPAARALWMVVAVFSGVLLSRQTGHWQVCALALGLMLLADPLAPLSPGFWLSFIAVAILLSVIAVPAASTEEQRWWHRLVLLVGTQARLSLVLVPLTALFFQQISWQSPLVNLLAIPLIGFVAVPLSLGSVVLAPFAPVPARMLLTVLDHCLGYYLQGLEWVMRTLPDPDLTLPPLSPTGWGLLCTLALCTVLLRSLRGKAVSICCVPLALLLRQPALQAGQLELWVFDAGQGLSVLVSTPSHALLYDTGPGQPEGYSTGGDIIVPSLQALGRPPPELVMVSHADTDHAGGLQALTEAWPQAQYVLPAALQTQGQVSRETCKQGTTWQWDTVRFTILHPGPGEWNRNNSSCVLLVSLGDQHILLTGDIERTAEPQVLSQLPETPLQVLLAPHHGSNSSSSLAFVRRTSPRHVIYASGYRNRYGHPTRQVQQRYAAQGSTAWMTGWQGAIRILLSPDAQTPVLSAWRESHPHLWSHPAPYP